MMGNETMVCEPAEQVAVDGLLGADRYFAPVMESTETIVRNVLADAPSWYGFNDDPDMLGRVVDILNDSAPREDPLAETAGRVRATLWTRPNTGGPAAAATCSIFCALGRQSELGWVAREAYLYTIGL